MIESDTATKSTDMLLDYLSSIKEEAAAVDAFIKSDESSFLSATQRSVIQKTLNACAYGVGSLAEKNKAKIHIESSLNEAKELLALIKQLRNNFLQQPALS